MKKFLPLLLTLTVAFALPTLADNPPPIDPNPDPIPVDGGVSFLVAAGVGYGVKRLRAKKALKAA